MAALKLGKLPDRAPVRVTLALSPELHRALTDYARLYHEAYGQEESLADLLPFMLQSFLDGDRSFARARRGLGIARGASQAPTLQRRCTARLPKGHECSI